MCPLKSGSGPPPIITNKNIQWLNPFSSLRVSPTSPSLVKVLLARYEIRKRIFFFFFQLFLSFIQVCRCTSPDGQEVAVKVIVDEHARECAAHEAEIMESIPSHCNLLPLLSFKSKSTYSLLVLPLATGGDSLKYMQSRGCTPLPEADARSLFIQLVNGVEHMHKSGFVHRDIKCENILLTGPRRRTVQLADFGFATSYRAGEQSLNEAWGSVHYSSPEIIAERSYEGPEIDVWSMGVVLYAWVTGRLPFGGNTDSELRTRICNGFFSLPTTLSPEITNLINGMLTVDRSKRFSIDEIRQHRWFAVDTSAPSNLPRAPTQPCIAVAPPKVPNPRRNSVVAQPTSTPRALVSAGKILRNIFGRK